MGALSTAGKNLMLDALKGTNPSVPITHAALFDSAAALTPTAVTSTDVWTLTSHGLSNGDLIVIDSKTGGTGLTLGRPYFVTGSTANTFTLSELSGGATVDVGTDVSASSIRKLVELTGGSPAYARKSSTFSASAGAVLVSSNAPVFDAPAGVTVDYVGWYSAVTAGTLLAVDDLAPESYTGQGTYTLSTSTLDLLQG